MTDRVICDGGGPVDDQFIIFYAYSHFRIPGTW